MAMEELHGKARSSIFLREFKTLDASQEHLHLPVPPGAPVPTSQDDFFVTIWIIIQFLKVGNPNLNLHFHYYWEGGQPK